MLKRTIELARVEELVNDGFKAICTAKNISMRNQAYDYFRGMIDMMAEMDLLTAEEYGFVDNASFGLIFGKMW